MTNWKIDDAILNLLMLLIPPPFPFLDPFPWDRLGYLLVVHDRRALEKSLS